MAEASGTAADQERTFATVARLVTAADGDTLYRDVYLRRAAEILSPIITETSYASALAGQAQLDRLLAKARAAVTRQDWQQAKELGAQAASLQRARETKSVAAAETVYGAPAVVLDPLSPGVRSKRWSNAT